MTTMFTPDHEWINIEDHEAAVVGITLQLYDHGAVLHRKGACCAGDDIRDARAVADRLGIAHYVIDHASAFREEVITRRTKFELNKARDRAHILLGLVVAELQQVQSVTADQHDSQANDEVGRDGNDGRPARLARAALPRDPDGHEVRVRREHRHPPQPVRLHQPQGGLQDSLHRRFPLRHAAPPGSPSGTTAAWPSSGSTSPASRAVRSRTA